MNNRDELIDVIIERAVEVVNSNEKIEKKVKENFIKGAKFLLDNDSEEMEGELNDI